MIVRLGFVFLLMATSAFAESITIGHRRFVIPEGYQLELIAGPPLTERPIVADFDEQGRLYVAESSGSNDNVQQQLETKPHSILRLEDSDGDGRFDKRTLFADQMMFPEGAMWLNGSLYVAAPPSIWRLTDADGDGVAEQREEWFLGKTLTGCANDLHGPYAGPDGWIYWCKGAFAEQTHARPGRDPLITRAAHVFRRRPAGGPIEAVMTGGMDNPVELVFTPGGERIFSTTFFQHPANGQRDGLIHAIYGGVYGKRHGVIDGHPRTGSLMPVLTHLGAAAPSGLARLESTALGYQNQLLTACFNLHSVTRHELVRQGATFVSHDSELVTCDDLDFHPTDVLEDANGSVLIVDTGGWYKLCCPTSQLHKPDVLGAIYRLSRKGAPVVADPRGLEIDWNSTTAKQLCDLLSDQRPFVRRRAVNRLGELGSDAIDELGSMLHTCENAVARTGAVWALCRIDHDRARAAGRAALRDSDEVVRQAAAHTVSVWRDEAAVGELCELLKAGTDANQRVAAEALGRTQSGDAVPQLLQAIDGHQDRVLEHSLIYALIELNAPNALRPVLVDPQRSRRHAALIALDQTDNLKESELVSALNSRDLETEALALAIASRHAQWGESIAAVLRRKLGGLNSVPDAERFAAQLATIAENEPIQELIADLLTDDDVTVQFKILLLEQLRGVGIRSERWNGVLSDLLAGDNPQIVSATVPILPPRTQAQQDDAKLSERLRRVAKSPSYSVETRLMAIQRLEKLDSDLFTLAIDSIASDRPAIERGLAAAVLSDSKLSRNQLRQLIEALATASPLELNRLLRAFDEQNDEAIGMELFATLTESAASASLPPERIGRLAVQFGDSVKESAETLYASLEVDPSEQLAQIEHLLQSLPVGDVRRGQQIFHDEKTACFACHAVGYRGGTIGPDLTRIGRVRSRRDLLESVVYPSVSFVRSYEPVNVITTDGNSLTGAIQDQNDDHLVLQLSATEQRRIATADIEEVLPGKISVMPAGLDQQLTTQQLADLLSYLESRK